jgi:putative tryptophan/tyrosine transport system substrate-binding protein
MRRRHFITLLGGAAAAWPLAARAQQNKVPRIGVLVVGSAEPWDIVRAGLRDLGYVDGQNIVVEFRSAEGDLSRLAALAQDLVQRKVDVIVASFTPAVKAAKQATREIPIVMAAAGDPVGMGLVATLARPGGNITGLSGTAPELGPKSLELIREIVPSATQVAVLGNAKDPFTKPFLEQIQSAGQDMAIAVQAVIVRSDEPFDAGFAAMIGAHAAAVIVQPSLPFPPAIELALKHHMPALSHDGRFARAGGLMSYGASVAERGREAAGYIDKILKGAKPADLPVQQPTKFEFVINLNTAKALGLEVSPTLLALANEVIE